MHEEIFPEYTLEELEKFAKKAIIENCDYLYKLLTSENISREEFEVTFISLVLCYVEPDKTFTPEILTDAINNARLTIIDEEEQKDHEGEEWKGKRISFKDLDEFWKDL